MTSKPAKVVEKLKFLDWFYCNVDFGPAEEDVIIYMLEQYEYVTGEKVPLEYDIRIDPTEDSSNHQ